jgi:hypothetical protein
LSPWDGYRPGLVATGTLHLLLLLLLLSLLLLLLLLL